MPEKFISSPEAAGKEKEFNTLKTWDELLELFGTDEARERFETLCKRYYGFLVKRKVAAQAEDVRAAKISDESQAHIHNKIMSAIYALLAQAKLTPEERKKFDALADRKRAAEMISDIFGPHSPAQKEKLERMTPLGKFRKDFDEND